MNSRRFEVRICTGALGRLLVAAHWRAHFLIAPRRAKGARTTKRVAFAHSPCRHHNTIVDLVEGSAQRLKTLRLGLRAISLEEASRPSLFTIPENRPIARASPSRAQLHRKR